MKLTKSASLKAENLIPEHKGTNENHCNRRQTFSQWGKRQIVGKQMRMGNQSHTRNRKKLRTKKDFRVILQ